jgi:voltage-gated potassium channel
MLGAAPADAVSHNHQLAGTATERITFDATGPLRHLVYATQEAGNPAIENYADALYFTVTTLTTTGFGDITLTGTTGRLLSVLIMIFGVSLFIRLAQTVFRPAKLHYDCPDCGLSRHDADAVHCKHCGAVIKLPTEGLD